MAGSVRRSGRIIYLTTASLWVLVDSFFDADSSMDDALRIYRALQVLFIDARESGGCFDPNGRSMKFR